jgi:PIN domain nuclease of toxin-antitoxin system
MNERLLLDTHTLLWWISDDNQLGTRARTAIQGAGSVCVSVATTWEIGIKWALGKLELDVALDQLVGDEFELVSISNTHAIAASQLPLIHRDPFDRMIVAQAITESRTIVTADALIPRYDVRVLNASD